MGRRGGCLVDLDDDEMIKPAAINVPLVAIKRITFMCGNRKRLFSTMVQQLLQDMPLIGIVRSEFDFNFVVEKRVADIDNDRNAHFVSGVGK